MKARLNLTIDSDILKNMKNYSQRKGESISEIVENHFASITRRKEKKKNIIQLVEELKPSKVDRKADLKDLFYKENVVKNGM